MYTKIKLACKQLVEFKLFVNLIQLVILTSLILFTIGTIPDISPTVRSVLNILEIISVLVFTLEYLVRLLAEDRSIKYVLSFNGITDLAAILPSILMTGVDLRAVRVFRLFRLFRIFKLFQYSEALNRVINAFNSIKNELIVFGVATVFLLYISAVGIYYFENPVQPDTFKSVPHSLWWAITTLTTIGYGDMVPVTAMGKVFTTGIVFLGMGVIAVPTGLFATAFSKTYVPK